MHESGTVAAYLLATKSDDSCQGSGDKSTKKVEKPQKLMKVYPSCEMRQVTDSFGLGIKSLDPKLGEKVNL